MLKEKEIEIEQLRMDAMKREEQTILTNQAMEAIQQEMSKTKEKNKVVSTQFMELETKLEVLKTERVKLLVDTEKAESSLKSSTELVSTLKKQKEGLIVEKEFWQEHGFSNINVAHVTLGRNDPMNPSSPMNNATNETKNDTTAIHFDNAKDQDLSKWQVGSGSDKRCYRGRWKKKDVAILRLVGNSVANSALNEADAFATLGRGHENLVTCYGWFEHDGYSHLLTEYAPGGKLSDVLNNISGRESGQNTLSVHVVVEILLQVCLGMECLHRVKPQSIVHRDLAARNVMVFDFSKDNFKKVDVRVTDFGLSKQLIGSLSDEEGNEGDEGNADKEKEKNKNEMDTDESRPLRYMSPETFQTIPQYSEKSDVWSFGVLIWEVMDGCKSWAPYPDIHSDDAVVAGIIGNSLTLKKPKGANSKLWKLVKKCRANNQDERPNFADIRLILEDLKMNLLTKLG